MTVERGGSAENMRIKNGYPAESAEIEETNIKTESVLTMMRNAKIQSVSTRTITTTGIRKTMDAVVITKENVTLTETKTDLKTEKTIPTEMNRDLVHRNERLDDLGRNGYCIIQDPRRFCFGIDAVLLSDFARVKKGEHALDLGTGTGIIPILLEAKTKGAHFTGLEIQPESAEMAGRSVIYNHLEEKVSIVEGDIKNASSIFGGSSMDVITTNPPYMIAEHGLQNEGDAKTVARHEVLCNLDDILRESARILRPNGRFYMVHRPFRLAEIFSKMISYRIEPKRMRLVHPYVDKEPNMVLIEGYRDGKSRLTVEKPLVVYKSPNVYTDEILEIYGKKG